MDHVTPQTSPLRRSRAGGIRLASGPSSQPRKMGAAAYVGRIGGLAVAMGVGAAVITGWGCGVAQADRPGSTSSGTAPSATDASSKQPAATSDTAAASAAPAATAKTAGGSTGAQTSTTTMPRAELRSAASGVVVATGGRNESSAKSGSTAPASAPVETAPSAVMTPPTVTSSPEPDAISNSSPEVTTEPDGDVAVPTPHIPAAPKSPNQPSGKDAELRTTDPSSAMPTSKIAATALVSDAGQPQSIAAVTGPPEAISASTIPAISLTPPVPREPAGLPAPSAPIGTPIGPDGVGIVACVVSTLINAVLSPFAATTTPGAPVEPPTLWTLLAVARRELGGAPFGQPPRVDSVAAPITTALASENAAQLADPSAAAATTAFNTAASETMFTGQPSLVNQVFVAALRLFKPVLSLIGIDLSGSSARIPFLTDGIPPFFLTFGLDVKSDEFDGMQVWTLTPAQPSGKVVVAVHGGGFVGEASIFHWLTYTALARDTGATVIVPNYPVANAAGTGGTAATVVPTMADFISNQIDANGAENVSVLGYSAGGTIALATTQELVRRCSEEQACLDEQLPSRLVLIAPVLDVSMTNPNIALVDDPLLNFESSQRNGRLWAAGLGTPEDPDGTKNPLASPLFGSLEDLPPITVYGGSLDLRTPDVLVLQQKAAATPGADFTFELRNGEIHDWIIFAFLPDAIAERPNIYRDLGLTGDEL